MPHATPPVARFPSNPQIMHGTDGVSFMVQIDEGQELAGQWVQIKMAPKDAEDFAMSLSKGLAAVDVMRERYKSGEEAFALHDADDKMLTVGEKEPLPIRVRSKSVGEIANIQARQMIQAEMAKKANGQSCQPSGCGCQPAGQQA